MEESIKDIDDTKFIDWNTLEMDELVRHLENKFMFDSSGTAFAVFKLIRFYKENKK